MRAVDFRPRLLRILTERSASGMSGCLLPYLRCGAKDRVIVLAEKKAENNVIVILCNIQPQASTFYFVMDSEGPR